MLVRTIAMLTFLAAAPVGAQTPGQRGSVPPAAQTPRSPQPGTAAPAARASTPPTPRREGQPVNLRIDFTISDQRSGAAAVKRTVSVMVADAKTGSIRTQSNVSQIGAVPLNIDASPELLADGKIRLGFNLQYDWPAPLEGSNERPARGVVMSTSLHDSVSMILENGKPVVAAQSADPIGDRQVTVEVKATILR